WLMKSIDRFGAIRQRTVRCLWWNVWHMRIQRMDVREEWFCSITRKVFRILNRSEQNVGISFPIAQSDIFFERPIKMKLRRKIRVRNECVRRKSMRLHGAFHRWNEGWQHIRVIFYKMRRCVESRQNACDRWTRPGGLRIRAIKHNCILRE